MFMCSKMDQPDENFLKKTHCIYFFEMPSTSCQKPAKPHNDNSNSLHFEYPQTSKLNLDVRRCSTNSATDFAFSLNAFETNSNRFISYNSRPTIRNRVKYNSRFNREFDKRLHLKQRSNEINKKLTIQHKYCSPYYIFILLSLTFFNSALATLLDTSVSCDQTNFVLSLNFDLPFRGIVYSEEGFPNCVYVNGTMLSHSSYQLKIPLIGCETRINEDGNFENAIIVQENSAFLQSTDKKYLLTCIPSTPVTRSVIPTTLGTTKKEDITLPNMFDEDLTLSTSTVTSSESMITVDFGGVTVENANAASEIIGGVMSPPAADGVGTSLKYAVEIRNGHSLDAPPLNAALNIGDPISYMVRLQKPVADSQVGRCWASDSKSNLELSDERGCTLQPRGNIWGAFERVENAREVIFVNRIKAWAFPTSNEVNIFCNLRICMSRVCAFGNCTAINVPSTTSENDQHKFHDPSDSLQAQLGRTRPELEAEEENENDGSSNNFFRGRARRQGGTNLGPESMLIPVKTAAVVDSGRMPVLPGLVPVRWAQPIYGKSTISLHNSEIFLRGQPIVPTNQLAIEENYRIEETRNDHLLKTSKMKNEVNVMKQVMPIFSNSSIWAASHNHQLDSLQPVRQINKLSSAESRTARQYTPKKAIHVGGLVGELTEVETLATQLRFRRQSIQRARVSPMKLVTADQLVSKDDDATVDKELASPSFTENNNEGDTENGADLHSQTIHHHDSPPNDNLLPNSNFGDNSFTQDESTAENVAVTPKPPSGAFSPKLWRIVAAMTFLALFAASLIAFFVLWRNKRPQIVEFFRYSSSRT